MKRAYAAVDLDGVVADVRHRLHHLEGGRKDWDAFFAGIADDPVHPEGLAVAEELAREHELVYLSGRPERTRAPAGSASRAAAEAVTRSPICRLSAAWRPR